MTESVAHRARWDVIKDVAELVKTLVLLVVFCLLVVYAIRELTRDVLIVNPIEVPQRLRDAGITPQILAQRIGQAIRQIELTTHTQMKKDNIASVEDEKTPPDIEIPGTSLGLKSLLDVARGAFGIYPQQVGGDIIFRNGNADATTKMCGSDQSFLTIYVSRSKGDWSSSTVNVDSGDVDAIVLGAASEALREVNPYILAAHQVDARHFPEAEAILARMTSDPGQDKQHVLAAYSLLGRALAADGRVDEALASFHEAIVLDAKYVPVYHAWGAALRAQHKYDEAIVMDQKAIAIVPKDAVAYNNWGLALKGKGEFNEAIAKYQVASRLEPSNPMPYNNWGNALIAQEQYAQAVVEFQKAVQVDPRFSQAYNDWGVAVDKLSQHTRAIELYRRAVELDPDFAIAYNNWGEALDAMNLHDQALDRYNEAIKRDPTYVTPYKNSASTLETLGRHSEADAMLRRVRELSAH